MSRKQSTPKEVNYFTAEVIMNDFVDNEMPHLKPAEIKLALVIWRKTIGWGKFSEQIGKTELCSRAGLDEKTVKRTVRRLCAKIGIQIDQTRKDGVLPRRQFTWPLNERVKAMLARAADAVMVGGKVPPAPRCQITPDREGPKPPTQSNTFQSSTKNCTSESGAKATHQGPNFLDLGFYSGADDP